MRPLRTIALGLALLVTLGACASDDGGGSAEVQPSLAGSSWVLTEVSVDGTMTAAVDNTGSINFDADGQLFGSTGCNRFSGTWSADGDALTLQTGPMTLMACPEPLQAQETALLGALAATRTYSIADDALTLTGDGGTQLAVYGAATTDLANTSWSATGVNNGKGGVVTTAETGDLTLDFGAVGTVAGFGGCSPFTGAFTTEGAGIAITELVAEPCSDAGRAPQQEEYLAALAAATNFSIDGTRLDLRDDSGALMAGFTATS